MESLQENTGSTIKLATAKLEENVLNEIKDLSVKANSYAQTVGNIHFAKIKLEKDAEQLNTTFKEVQEQYFNIQARLNEIADSINKLYPGGLINIEDGTVTYRSE